MTPFNVRIKQENRDGVPNAQNVAFVRYVEINVFGREYRLLKRVANRIQFSVDGQLTDVPYYDAANQVSVFLGGGRLWFTTKFSLNVAWDGDVRFDVNLCSTYSKYVCGLCGNADGKYKYHSFCCCCMG